MEYSRSWAPRARTARRAGMALGCALLQALAFAEPAAAQGGSIGGQVIDGRTLAPVMGARVEVVERGVELITDAQGRFTAADLGAGEVTLRVTMLGYRPVTRVVAVGGGELRLLLDPSAIELDQIVVTGTAGAVQRRSIGNSVSQVRASTIAETAPVQNLGQLLNARAPGVAVLPPSGLAGGGSRVLIRGKSSFSLSSDPLVYVDGVRVDNRGPVGGGTFSSASRLDDFTPEQIESIEIIKGPAAATLYGTEAANGVINIITRRGQPGGVSISGSLRQGVAWLMDPEGRWPVNYYRDPATNQVLEFNIAQAETDAGRPIFRTGRLQGYGLTVSGGSAGARYHAGLNYDHDQGAVRTNSARRVSGNLNLGVSPNSTLDLHATSVFTFGRARFGNDIMFDAVLSRPENRSSPTRGFYSAPPEIQAVAREFNQDVNRFVAGVEANHRPAGWLTQRLKTGVDVSNQQNITLVPRLTGEVASFYTPAFAQGSKTVAQTNVLSTTVDYGVTATAALAPGITSSTSVGAQYYRQMVRMLTATGERFPAPGVETVAGAAVTRGSDDFVENVTVGLYVQEQVSFNDRMFFTAALRGDDNSAFGREFDFVIYPKLSGTWVVSEEPFWRFDAVDALKLRVAYGHSGQQPRAFSALRTYEPVTGQAGAAAVTPQFIGNPDLGPERSAELEAGFEGGLFDQRVGVDFTFYNRTTRDAIVLRDVAPSSGFPQQQFVNVGSIRNRGIELLLTGKVLERRSAGLDLTLNLARNTNEVLELGLGGIPYLETGFGNRIQPGYPVNAAFARRVVSADRGPDGVPTNIRCDDGQGGAVDCAAAPKVYAGTQEPTFQGSASAALRIRDRVTLSTLVDWKTGHRLWSSSLWCPGILGCEDEIYPERFDPVYAASSFLGLTDDARWWMDVGFVKLREISLDYRVPEAWARRFGASRATIAVAARNLHTWTSFPGLDPENVAIYSDIAIFSTQYEQNEVPQLAQFVTRINFSF